MNSFFSNPKNSVGATENVTRVPIAIVEDDAQYRRRLLNTLQQVPNWRIVATCDSIREAQIKIVPARPEVVLLDIELPIGSGIDLIRPLRAQLQSVRIVMLTVVERTTAIVQAIRAGASGYILKSDGPPVVEAIEDIMAGRAPVMSPSVARQLWRHAAEEQPLLVQAGSGLTDREWEVLRLATQGRQHDAISKELGISPHTVKTHMAHIYAKLGASSPMEAVTRLHGQGGLLAPSKSQSRRRPTI